VPIDYHARSLIAAPLMVRGRTVGVLAAYNKREGLFTEIDLDLTYTFASSVSQAIENAWLFQRIRQRHQELLHLREEISLLNSNYRTHENTGIKLIRIPAGLFFYGSSESDKMASENEKPQQMINLSEFWISRTPITNDQFARFVEATNYQTTAERDGLGWGWTSRESKWNEIEGADWRHPRGPKSSIDDKDKHPVVQVSWDDAKAYCDWAGLTLPTEQQWEKAARGTDGRIWPWGNDVPTEEHCNFNRNVSDTTPVGRYSPRGDSLYGCVDMAGNVWEWTESWHTVGSTRALRGGGSWSDEAQFTRAVYRPYYDLYPHIRLDNVGFRVVELLSDPES
jgi:formylglycine-generating enzyme required for sulfatase activity